MRIGTAYRGTGADWPFGDPSAAHGVAMEGYFWRVTDPTRGRVVVALAGINRGPRGPWATLGLAAAAESMPGGHLALADPVGAWADPRSLGVRVDGAGGRFVADARRVSVALGQRSSLELTITEPAPWPRRRFGGSSVFQVVPGLNQYWHPWLLGGKASGRAIVGDEEWDFTDAQVYGEKNWGREGFPDTWWWGQAQGFVEPDACVAFAGGQVTAGPLHTEVTALAVRLPESVVPARPGRSPRVDASARVLRLGNPLTSPVTAHVTDTRWELRGSSRGWSVEIHAAAPLDAAHVLPVPLPSEGRNAAGAIEHLVGRLEVEVRRGGRLVWEGATRLAGLEHGGRARADAELTRRGIPLAAAGAAPVVRRS